MNAPVPTKPRFKPTAAQLWGSGPDLEAAATAHNAASYEDPALESWVPPVVSPDAALIPELPAIVPRAQDLERNNPLAAGGVQTLKDNIIGSQLRLSAKPDLHLLGRDREWGRAWSSNTEAWFRAWADSEECDAARTQNLWGLTLQAVGGALLNGDALALPLWLPRPGSAWGTRLMVVSGERLETPPAREADPRVRGGKEIDANGAPVAYWIRRAHPGDEAVFHDGTLLNEYTRVPAFTSWGRRRVVHLHDPAFSGQSRGRSVFTAVMREFRMAGQYTGHELHAAAANALIAAFVESSLDQDSVAALFGQAKSKTGQPLGPEVYWRKTLAEYGTRLRAGGAVIPLPIGAKLSSFNPGRPNAAFDAFMHAVLRYIAAGLNIPYELLVKDFSQTNYSSARAALLEAWRYFQGRRTWLRHHWLQPVYELWMEEAVDRGRVEAEDWYDNRYAYCRSRWIFAGRGWVDPGKEAQAAKTRLEIGISTQEEECAEQGRDWEDVEEQKALEIVKRKEISARYGLTAQDWRDFGPQAAASPAGKQKDGGGGDGNENEDEDEEEEAA